MDLMQSVKHLLETREWRNYDLVVPKLCCKQNDMFVLNTRVHPFNI